MVNCDDDDISDPSENRLITVSRDHVVHRRRTRTLEQSSPNLALRGLSYGQFRRTFYSDSEATGQCELFLTAPYINIFTYLLIYVHA